jgi:hypothetical protein
MLALPGELLDDGPACNCSPRPSDCLKADPVFGF